MKKNLFLMLLLPIFCIVGAQEKTGNAHPAQRIVINNRHTITQIVAERPHKEQNAQPGTPPSLNSSTNPLLDNEHLITQKSTRTLRSTKEFSYTLPSHQHTNAAYFSYLALLVPPIFMKMSWLQYGAGVMGISYGGVLAKLLHYAYTISSSKSRWALWHADISLQAMRMQEKQYAQELCTAIQTQYHDAPAHAHFLSPLMHFINDLNKELEQAHAFITLHAALDRCKIAFLFPEQSSTVHHAHDAIARLEYLKILVVNGIGEYNVECTNP